MNDVTSPDALSSGDTRELVDRFRTTLDAIRTQVRRSSSARTKWSNTCC